MVDFYIKQLSVTGVDVRPAILNFQRGTNIIYGDSDYGKSYVVECIDYLFGAKTMRLKSSSGYNRVSMIIQTSQGEIHLERRFDVKKESVTITTTDPRYTGLTCTGLDRDVLDSFWMRLIGIGENQTVVTSGYYARELLKWNNISKLLLHKETAISGNKSAIQSGTKQLSTLLFLLTGQDFIEEPTLESDKDRIKKEAGAKQQIERQMEELQKRQIDIFNLVNAPEAQVVQRDWADLLERFSFEEQRLQTAISDSRKLHRQMDEARKKLSSYLLQAENHKLLKGLYDAQAKRLAFTIEGQLLTIDHDAQCTCPFCGATKQEACVDKDVMDATRAEFEQAEIAIQHFYNANNELNTKIERLQRRIAKLEKKCAGIDETIATAYAPSVTELKRQMGRYLDFVRLQHELDLISTDLSTLQTKKDSLGGKPTAYDVKYRPKEWFPDDFQPSMSSYLHNMLTACDPERFSKIRFEMARMDVSVELQDKDTFGEGWRAFLNTAVAFSLFQHLCAHGTYVPGLLILDSPIQAMKQPEGSRLTTQLFNYIIHNSDCGQVFLIENKLPDGLDTEKARMFSLSPEGFLPDFKHPVKYRKDASEAEAKTEAESQTDA